VHRTLLRTVELAMAALFLYLGATKLVGSREIGGLFDVVGLGSWGRYALGILELIGAALFARPVLSRGASWLLAGIMVVVAVIEVAVLKRPPGAAALCVSAHAFVTWGRRQNARWRLTGSGG
jgi:uncharacterized membrane protein YphA (DoxX/SURF4 family)